MKIWIVLSVLGKTAGVSGPLPYAMEECHPRAAEVSAEFDAKYADGTGVLAIGGRRTDRSDVSVTCVESPFRPQIEPFEAGASE